MEKIVIGSNLPKNLIDIDYGVKKNIKLLSDAKNKKISDLNACVLKRSRHDKIVKELSEMNVNINYITDGDIAGALSVIGDKPKNDIYYSTGGGPEGVIVAAALSCYGGQIQGRLVLDEEEKIRAKKLGITDFQKKYNIEDMVKGDVIFCATGVTSGDLATGVKDLGNEFEVNTFALHKSQKVVKSIVNIYNK
jgi:fructose-1,6-bisphosphatase II / sedoheptulose-1,7-bisphosphatase